MEYKLKIGEEIATVEATAESNDHFSVIVGEQTFKFGAHYVASGHIRLECDGTPAQNVYAAATEEGLWLWLRGKARLVQDADRLPARRSARGGLGGGPRAVTPPTPATVVAVTAEVGQHVDKGTALVVVSAMKMEITLTAPYPGTITAVNTEVGKKANPGEILVEIAPDEEEKKDE